MIKSNKPKVKPEIVYSVNLRKEEFNEPVDSALFDIIKDKKEFVVRYYGCCAVKREQTLEMAINYVRSKLFASREDNTK